MRAALRAGLHDVAKASIAGSIIRDMPVLGAPMFAGGLRHSEQTYNAAGTRSQATLLTPSTMALVLPAAYSFAVCMSITQGVAGLATGLAHDVVLLSLSISVVLIADYGLFLVFSLITHKALFVGSVAYEAAATPRHCGRCRIRWIWCSPAVWWRRCC